MPRAARVKADRRRLQQVLINLLRNAIDATKSVDQPQVDILLTGGKTARISVRDNGPGVEDLDKLFEPFYTTKPDGIGMGLAINRTIIRAHGGRIWATPNAERGATFRFRLPTNHQTDMGDVANGNGKRHGN